MLGHVEDPVDVAAVASACPRLRAVARFAPLRLKVSPSRFMRTSEEEGPFVHQGQLRAFLLGFSSAFTGAPSSVALLLCLINANARSLFARA